MLIDSHAHIYAKQFDNDSKEMLQNAKAAGIEKIVMPNIDLNSIESMHKLAEKYPQMCYPTMGLHPCSVKENYQNILTKMRTNFEERKYYAVGECGLDYHWDLTFKQEQIAALETQIAWANELELPLILHTRKSFEDAYDIVRSNKSSSCTGVFHCFGESVEAALKVFEMGFYIGIGGVLTFKKAGLTEVLKVLPLDKVILETDSPYLAPVPFRGKRNEPAYVKYVAELLAETKGITLNEVAEITSKNAIDLFQL